MMRGLTTRNEQTGEMEWNAGEREQIAAWVQADPEHKGVSPDIFTEDLTESIMFGDEGGDLFAVRLSRTIRLDIQFNPGAEPERVQQALLKYFSWVQIECKKKGFRQLIFESTYRPLIAFCMRRFGFKSSPNEFRANT